MYRSYFTESFPYIKEPAPTKYGEEFNVERLLSLDEKQLQHEGLLLTEAGVIGSLLGGAAKAVGKGALAVGKAVGKAALAGIKAAVTSLGKDLVTGIKKTANKYTPNLMKFSANAYEETMKKLHDKLVAPKGLQQNIVPVVNELYNDMKPTLSKIMSNPEMNDQAWANFMGILALDYLQKVAAPALADSGQQINANELSTISQAFQKALLTKMKPLMDQAEKKAKNPVQTPTTTTQQQFDFKPAVTTTGAQK
jgi:hypothetical protein